MGKYTPTPEQKARYAARRRERYAENPEAGRLVASLWRARHPDYKYDPAKAVAATQRWRDSHREQHVANIRRRNLRKMYGITVEQYDQMLAEQNGGCALCGKPPEKKRLSVDHDHSNGKVRGLLCRHCNFMIGLAREEPKVFEAAIAYLAKNVGAEPTGEVLPTLEEKSNGTSNEDS